MTIPDTEQGRDKPEWTARFLTPPYDMVDQLGYRMIDGTSPLEDTFIRWVLLTNDPAEAFRSIRHPALPVVDFGVTPDDLLRRPNVRQNLKKIRDMKPFIQLYSADYMLSIVHEEVEHLRLRNRKKRFDDGQSINGKKSRNEEENNTIETLMKCLDTARNLVKEADDATSGNPSAADASSVRSSVDRVVAEAARLIQERTSVPAE